METLRQALREAPVVDRDGYHYFVHGVTDGIPLVEPDVLRSVADGITERVDLESVDKLVAPEAMGIHHATALSLETDLPFVVVRKRAYGFDGEVAVHQETGYGESELYVNGVAPGERVVVVDDVLSSGNTLRGVCAALEEIGAEIAAVVVVLERTDVEREELSHEVTSLLEIAVEDGRVVVG
ncbi:hypoxanthine/guanine phosphoribosyltransferase [Natrononativus amylolyticus]|uniref:hypoxanthine/guanine phosphoribosyltransferase n=1 Tax=Natrononativus amylolyticus TaxID=2963434 RepID=UPI0020CD2DFE|nr:hypoxanthine/guanine phosphoribosyltransferase [Natrononativus amylolyticus]